MDNSTVAFNILKYSFLVKDVETYLVDFFVYKLILYKRSVILADSRGKVSKR